MSDDRLDQLLRLNARAIPAPEANHQALFFERLDQKKSMKWRRVATLSLTGIFAAAAAFFFFIYQAPVKMPSAEVVQMKESVETYNALVDDDDDVYSLLAIAP